MAKTHTHTVFLDSFPKLGHLSSTHPESNSCWIPCQTVAPWSCRRPTPTGGGLQLRVCFFVQQSYFWTRRTRYEMFPQHYRRFPAGIAGPGQASLPLSPACCLLGRKSHTDALPFPSCVPLCVMQCRGRYVKHVGAIACSEMSPRHRDLRRFGPWAWCRPWPYSRCNPFAASGWTPVTFARENLGNVLRFGGQLAVVGFFFAEGTCSRSVMHTLFRVYLFCVWRNSASPSSVLVLSSTTTTFSVTNIFFVKTKPAHTQLRLFLLRTAAPPTCCSIRSCLDHSSFVSSFVLGGSPPTPPRDRGRPQVAPPPRAAEKVRHPQPVRRGQAAWQ